MNKITFCVFFIAWLSNWQSIFAQAGDTCETAVVATIGANTTPASASSFYWFEFTALVDGKINITTSNRNILYFSSGNDCSNLEFLEWSFSNLKVSGIIAGDTYYISWDVASGLNPEFEWELTNGAVEPGDDCENATIAVLGTNSLPVSTNSFYWYEFTAVSDGKININSTAGTSVRIDSGSDCNSLTSISNGRNSASATGVVSGEKYYIVWQTTQGGDFDWELINIPSESGDACDIPELAVIGINTVPTTTNNFYWFEYTAQVTGKLVINSDTRKTIELYSGNCSSLNLEVSDFFGLQYAAAIAGETYFIKWPNLNETGLNDGNFEFELLNNAVGVGDNCDLAATANIGLNTVPETTNFEYWYEFTAATTGKIAITAQEVGYVSIYSGDCVAIEVKLEDNRGLQYLKAVAGQDYLIKFKPVNRESFEWRLSNSVLGPGDSCESGIIASVGVNTVPITDNYWYWYEFTAINTADIIISSSGNQEIGIYVGESCSTFRFGRFNNGSVSLPAISGETYYIVIRDLEGGNFDWQISNDPPNNNPNDINLSNSVIDENNALNDEIGTFSTSDPDSDDTHSYTMVSGAGDLDNNSFQISDNQLLAEEIFDFETKSTYNIRVQTDDGNGGLYKKEFTITINDVFESQSQIINFSPLSEVEFGDPSLTLMATSSSGLLISYTSSNEEIAIINGNILTILSAGSVTITASQDGDSFFEAADPVSQLLIVNKADQEITLSPIDDQFVDAPPIEINASNSSGLDLNYNVTGPATVADNFVSLSGIEGVVTVTATQPGGANFTPSTESISFEVFKREQIITFTEIDDQLIGDENLELVATSSSGLSVSFEIATGSDIATLSGSSLSFTAPGLVVIEANQIGNEIFNAADPVERSCEVLINTVTSTKFDEEELIISLYPNPSSNQIRIMLKGYTGSYQAFLQDLKGTTVIETDKDYIDVSEVNKGVYLLIIKSDDFVRTFRIGVKN